MFTSSAKAGNRHRTRGLFEKGRASDQRTVRVAAQEIITENFIETIDVGILYRRDVVAIERKKGVVIRCWFGLQSGGWHRIDLPLR